MDEPTTIERALPDLRSRYNREEREFLMTRIFLHLNTAIQRMDTARGYYLKYDHRQPVIPDLMQFAEGWIREAQDALGRLAKLDEEMGL